MSDTKVPDCNCDTKLPDSNGDSKLPDSNGDSKLPDSNGDSKLPDSNGDSKLPDSNCDTKLPDSNCDTKLPDSNCDTKLPHPNGDTNLPDSNGNTKLPDSNCDTKLPHPNGDTKLPDYNSVPNQPAYVNGVNANGDATATKNEKKEFYEFKSMEFEDILSAVGDYGKYQKRMVYFFLIPTSTILPFFCMNLIFMLSSPDHWCMEPTVSASNLSMQDKRLLLSPWINDADGNRVLSPCHMYDVDYSSVISQLHEENVNVSSFMEMASSEWDSKTCANGWEYDQQYYTSTATTKWDLVCLRNYLPSLVFTLSNAGSAVGTPILGYLSDKIGRKTSYIITAVVALISSISTVLVSNFVLFVIVRTINGGLLPSVFQIPYLILVEMVSPEKRTMMNGICCVSWTLGLAAVPLAAYVSGDWVTFGWICALATLPYVCYVKFLPESPRWLMSQGKYEEASRVLNEVAKTNGKDVSHLDLINVFKKFEAKQKKENEDMQEYASPLELFKNPVIRKRFVILSLSWIADSMCYYGFHINVSHLYGNEFVNFFLLAAVELPSYLTAWYLIETRLGRRWCNAGFLLLMGLGCLIPVLSFNNNSETLTTVASLIGKFGCSASYMVMYQQAAEIFPTPLRASGLGLAGTLAAIVTICTPYIIYLGHYSRHIPFTIMGFVGILAGIAALFLPETLNENLPQTVEDGERFGHDQPFFSLAKRTPPVRLDLNEHKMSMENIA